MAASGRLAFSVEPLSVRRARQFAVGVCVSLTPPQLDDVLLCVSELVTNVVLHARSGGELRLTVQADGVHIEVDDASPEAPRLAGVDPAVGGRGLRIVNQLAAAWGHAPRAGGKTVWVELPASPAPVGGARPRG